ncbi:hypothetical protein SAMN02745148_00072 [Modicisalibacter ilicicola DSM 19980]|uniref:Uncharacterized protein n=1 Tax=Modicisalibacter ilicicola DSM 19980 TaxID=1121942 RepID=A0A1M4SD07_9GAMM|nr:hypothetical protein [Halomonas ilicicola]SHE30099.1 hypothetical protein SAMN02745148_00072 [Halomonas ilicicola DSM 19980]
MDLIETFIVFSGAFLGLIGVAMMFIASIVALFKIDEADDYYGEGKLGGGKSDFKGLPFSLSRMTWYGMAIMFSRTKYVKNHYGHELAQIAANDPPRRLERLLVWLFAPWFILVMASMMLGGLLMLFPEA